MGKISLFTSINYTKPQSYTEWTLSKLSNCFYFGGKEATVIRGDEVRLKSGKISWYMLGLKVASFVLFFPFTITLFAIHLTLRYQHNFTIVNSSRIERKLSQKSGVLISQSDSTARDPSIEKPLDSHSKKVIVQDLNETPSSIPSSKQTPAIFLTSRKRKEYKELDSDIRKEKPNQTLSLNIKTQNAENVVPQKVLSSPRLKKSSFEQKEIRTDNKEAESISLEEFKEELKFFLTDEENPQQMAKELFRIAPKTLNLADIVNLIFEECRENDILLLLNAILIAKPSFRLSLYDKIRRMIVADKQHVLNNDSLIAMLKEHALDQDEAKLTACYDLAYRTNHPYIYRLSQTPILPSEVSLNCVWINFNPQDRTQDIAQHIFKDGLDPSENADCIKDPKVLRALEKNEQSLEKEELENWNKIKQSFTYRLSKWADLNPGAKINLWYDSALVTQKAQQKTFEMMKSLSESRGVNLKLRDIRQLPNIGGEIGNSLHPGTPVYYRVDLLKALIADAEKAKYVVIFDIDAEAMGPQQIFEQRTQDYLASHGYVFNRMGLGQFENSFFIFNKENENLKKIHYETIIKRTATHIASLRKYPIEATIKSDNLPDSQFIYKQYPRFRQKMKEVDYELDNGLANPRKVVKCPPSQFNFGSFPKFDHRAEAFRFIGDSKVPYTINGRSFDQKDHAGEIKELINWKAEPLPLLE